MKKLKKVLCVISLIFGTSVMAGAAPLWIDFENGVVFSSYNNARIDGDDGTKFSLTDDLETKPRYFFRLQAGLSFWQRHHVQVLYAPLQLKARGTVDKDIVFKDHTFQSGSDLTATFKFNSYRLTYTYDILANKKGLVFGIGLTGKVRDAKIALEDDTIRKQRTDLGFVPLVHLKLKYIFSSSMAFGIEGDGLASPQGRAFDFLAAAEYQLEPGWPALKLGYRILEGGADNDKVYTFTMLHYWVAGLTMRF